MQRMQELLRKRHCATVSQTSLSHLQVFRSSKCRAERICCTTRAFWDTQKLLLPMLMIMTVSMWMTMRMALMGSRL